MSMTIHHENWRDETALKRHEIIAPLLDDTLDHHKRQLLREQQAVKYGRSVRTIHRYERAYKEGGFAKLRPCTHEQRVPKRRHKDFDHLLKEAIELKREVPLRSVQQIIAILEMEGRVEPGVLTRPTLQRHLFNAGYGKNQMRRYIEAKTSGAGRFVKPHRMMLIQADIKYGPKLPIGKDGAKVQTYLSAAIDDCTRFIVASGFYANQEAAIVEDTFRQAILKYGQFDSAYVDNGKQYVSKNLQTACAKLGIRLMRCKPYSAKSKGKIEKFNGLVNGFIAEIKADRVKTLEELNRLWKIWLDAYYHSKPHSALDDEISPMMAFNRDSRRLTFLDVDLVAEAFLHHEIRRVDKSGCISFKSQKYEVGMSLIGTSVEIIFDPMNLEKITITYKDLPPFEAVPLHIGEFCGKSPGLPGQLTPTAPETSRFLRALEKKHALQKARATGAISFGTYRRGAQDDV